MNFSIIRKIIGYVLILEASLMLLPCFAALYYGEREGTAYAIVAGVCAVFGGAIGIKKPKNTVFYLKEGCVATALSWIVLSVFGCIPFILTREIPSFINAFFEATSGFTTTGSTILDNVEEMSRATLLWRSLTHWIGGMGVLVFIMAVVPLSGGSNINLMRAESPGPSVGKLVPKMRETARWLYVIYIVFTVLELVFLVAGKMPFFDAVCTSIGTAGTGGFGVRGDSLASYSPYVQWVVTVFMFLFGINFNAYYFILLRQIKKAFSITEIKVYIGIVLTATAFVFFNIRGMFASASDTLRVSAFQVSSLVTSTGFTTVDYESFPNICKLLFLMLMTVGACSGSTGGGIKVSRFIIAVKGIYKDIYSYVHPKSIRKSKMNSAILDDDMIRSTNVYMFTFFAVFAISMFIVSFENKSLVTSFSAVLATINNIGPGMEAAGPSESFSSFSVLSKCVFIFDMLAGRLELFPILLLFHPRLWIDTFTQKRALVKKNKI